MAVVASTHPPLVLQSLADRFDGCERSIKTNIQWILHSSLILIACAAEWWFLSMVSLNQRGHPSHSILMKAMTVVVLVALCRLLYFVAQLVFARQRYSQLNRAPVSVSILDTDDVEENIRWRQRDAAAAADYEATRAAKKAIPSSKRVSRADRAIIEEGLKKKQKGNWLYTDPPGR